MAFDHERFARVFFPFYTRRAAEVQAAGGRFAYYTTAATAADILRSATIWMRQPGVMNDAHEVLHGSRCLAQSYQGADGEVLRRTLDECFPGLSEEIQALLPQMFDGIYTDSYLTCVSEHVAADDRHGRLSMWRAYGASSGVAIVLNGAPMFTSSSALGAYSSPVFYGHTDKYGEEFRSLGDGVAREALLLIEAGRDVVKNAVLLMMRYATLCTKHPGFAEEREWRVIASPLLHSTPHITAHVETVGGVPQQLLKLKLKDVPKEGLTGISIPSLVNRIIIGPCAQPYVTRMAMVQLLGDAGVERPWERVFDSDIPLRQVP